LIAKPEDSLIQRGILILMFPVYTAKCIQKKEPSFVYCPSGSADPKPINIRSQTGQTKGNISQVWERGIIVHFDFPRPDKQACSLWHIVFLEKCWCERYFGECRRQSLWLVMKSDEHSGSNV
jgi:hypothetical protein